MLTQKRLCFTLLFLLLLLATPITAQETTAPSPPRTWTIQQAVHFGLKNNPDTRAAQRRIEFAQASIKQARAAFYPSLDISGEYVRTNNPMYSFGNILNQGVFSNAIDFNNPGVTDDLQLKAILAYRLYNGGRDQHGLNIARLQKEITEREKQALFSTLGFEVVRTFYTILQAEETVQTRKAIINSLNASIKVAQARLNAGDCTCKKNEPPCFTETAARI